MKRLDRLTDLLLGNRVMQSPITLVLMVFVNVWLQTALEFPFGIRLVLNVLVAFVAYTSGMTLGRRLKNAETAAIEYQRGYVDALIARERET